MDNIPKVPLEIKNKLNLKFKKKGLIYLQEKLKEIDLDYYNKVDLDNPNRLIRAIGVYEVSGKKISSLWNNNSKNRNFNSLIIMIKSLLINKYLGKEFLKIVIHTSIIFFVLGFIMNEIMIYLF